MLNQSTLIFKVGVLGKLRYYLYNGLVFSNFVFSLSSLAFSPFSLSGYFLAFSFAFLLLLSVILKSLSLLLPVILKFLSLLLLLISSFRLFVYRSCLSSNRFIVRMSTFRTTTPGNPNPNNSFEVSKFVHSKLGFFLGYSYSYLQY